jgi:hypothetical protein
VQSLVEL